MPPRVVRVRTVYVRPCTLPWPSTVLTFLSPDGSSLFDMDGTLIDSTAGVEGAWKEFQKTYPHINAEHVFSSSHGIRTVENLRNHCGIEDPGLLASEAVRFEKAIVTSASANGGRGVVRLPGVEEAMKALVGGQSLPHPYWAICTSSTREYSVDALTNLGIPVPDVLVTSELVERGKPCPDPYLLGAKLCGVAPAHCIVIEDSPNGIRSGQAAGCQTIGILTTHTRGQVEAVKPDWIVDDLSKLSFALTESGVEITICEEVPRAV